MLQRIFKAVLLRVATRRARARARADSDSALAASGARRVLVLCYGNIYRSPFVAVSLQQALGDRVQVRSAGFHAKQGRASPASHVAMSAEFGVSLDAHRSATVTAADLDWADLIVLMDRHNWARLHAMGADPARVVWLGALVPGPIEIPDPYGLPEAQVREILGRLSLAAGELTSRILSKN